MPRRGRKFQNFQELPRRYGNHGNNLIQTILKENNTAHRQRFWITTRVCKHMAIAQRLQHTDKSQINLHRQLVGVETLCYLQWTRMYVLMVITNHTKVSQRKRHHLKDTSLDVDECFGSEWRLNLASIQARNSIIAHTHLRFHYRMLACNAIQFYQFCPFVCPRVVLCLNEWTYCHSFFNDFKFLRPTTIKKL